MKSTENLRVRLTPGAAGIALFAVFLVRALAHAMWRDELQAWLIACGSESLPALVQNARYEGHPLLWYVLLFFVSRFTHEPWALQALGAVFASATLWLIIFKAPFDRNQKWLLALGYFLSYEYGVLSRHYSPEILLLVLACLLLERRSLWRFVGAISLLAHTCAFGLILSAALGMAGLVHLRPPLKTALAATAACLGSALLAARPRPGGVSTSSLQPYLGSHPDRAGSRRAPCRGSRSASADLLRKGGGAIPQGSGPGRSRDRLVSGVRRDHAFGLPRPSHSLAGGRPTPDLRSLLPGLAHAFVRRSAQAN